MQHAVDMQIVDARPLHQLVDDAYRFRWIIDVQYQVSDAVDDNQTAPGFFLQGVFYQLQSHGRMILSQTIEYQVGGVHVLWNSCQPQDALHHHMAVVSALLGVYIQYLTLSFWQTGSVLQNLLVSQRGSNDCRHIKGLPALCLSG